MKTMDFQEAIAQFVKTVRESAFVDIKTPFKTFHNIYAPLPIAATRTEF